ncbi:hypothetical protein BD779DRAFT_1524898 [Infundibulicybe gibba]|nr:hypothetical protein BD779DRAFT_1524898 [Infundibulicybe gibba]
MPIPRVALSDQNLNIPRPPTPHDPPTEDEVLDRIDYKTYLRQQYVGGNSSITTGDLVAAYKYKARLLAPELPPVPAPAPARPEWLDDLLARMDRMEQKINFVARLSALAYNKSQHTGPFTSVPNGAGEFPLQGLTTLDEIHGLQNAGVDDYFNFYVLPEDRAGVNTREKKISCIRAAIGCTALAQIHG